MNTNKKSFPSAYSILFSLIIIMALLTWIIPSGKYNYQNDEKTGRSFPLGNTYQTVEQRLLALEYSLNLAQEKQNLDLINEITNEIESLQNIQPQGIWHVILAPIKGFNDALDIALVVLMAGAFINVTMRTKALDAAIASIIKSFKGKEEILIIILVFIFSLGGTNWGLAEESIPFYAIIIPLFLMAGYDTLLPTMIILLGSGIGVLASTINPYATGIASYFAGVSLSDGMGIRYLMLFVFNILLSAFLVNYAKKIKKDISKSVVYSHLEEDKKHFLQDANHFHQLTKKRKVVLLIFTLTFIILILSVIPWDDADFPLFTEFFVNLNTKLLSIPMLGNIIGFDFPALGHWWFNEISALFFFAAILIGFIYRFKEKEWVKYFLEGATDILPVSLIIVLSRGVKVIMEDGGISDTILYFGETYLSDLNGSLFAILNYIFFIPLSFLIPSTSGLATFSMSIMAPMAELAGVSKSIIVTAFQSAEGIVNLITPTSGVVMGALSIARIPYNKFLKFIAPFLLISFITTIIFLVIAVQLK